ncbi:hypothetical protein KCU81_g849, partial [Aureobasidium melanogenum]
MFNKVLQSPLLLNRDLLGQVAAHRTVVLLFVFERVCVDAVVSAVHHVIVCSGVTQEWVCASCNLECLVTARGGNDGIG